MNTESLNILKGIVDTDKLHQAKVISQENLALSSQNASLSTSNKNLKTALYVALAALGAYGLYYYYKKHNNDRK